jgi:hypothetical protein
MATFAQRLIGAARLDPATYEEVEADRSATGQALLVVVLVSIASGLGSGGGRSLVGETVAALVGWGAWAFVIWIVGAKLFPEPQTRSDMGELLRTIGFASTPGLLRVFGFVPLFGPLLSFVAWLWMLIATVVAVRQALDYNGTGRAIFVCVLGFLFYIGVIIAVGVALGIGAGLFGALQGGVAA